MSFLHHFFVAYLKLWEDVDDDNAIDTDVELGVSDTRCAVPPNS